MKAKTGETTRMLLASLFMLVSLGAALVTVLGLARSFIVLGDEEWLKVAVWFVAAVIAVPVFLRAWKQLKRHRPTDAIPEKWRSKLRRETTPREKFTENLNAYTWMLLGAAILFAGLLAAFGATLQSADSTLGTRLQFLVLLIALPAALAGLAIGIRKDVMAFAPAEEPIERRPRSLWRSICFLAFTICLLLVTGTFLVLGAGGLTKLVILPSAVQEPIEFLISAAMFLVGGGVFACLAFSVLRDEWKRHRQPSAEAEIVGGMARYTGGEPQP